MLKSHNAVQCLAVVLLLLFPLPALALQDTTCTQPGQKVFLQETSAVTDGLGTLGDEDGDGISDAQEREDGTDPLNPRDNALYLVVDGEFAVGKTVTAALFHPTLDALSNTPFTITVKERSLELVSDRSGHIEYEIVNSGLHKLTATSGRFSISKSFAPACSVTKTESEETKGGLTALLVYASFVVGVLSYNVNLRHVGLHNRGFRRVIGLLSVYIGLAFFAIPLLASVYINLTLAMFIVFFELVALIYLNYMYKLYVYTQIPNAARTRKARLYRQLFGLLAMAEDFLTPFLSANQAFWLRRNISGVVVKAVSFFNRQKSHPPAPSTPSSAEEVDRVQETLRQQALSTAGRLGELEAMEGELSGILQQMKESTEQGASISSNEIEAVRKDLEKVRAQRKQAQQSLSRIYGEME